ncbi:hypothetical protein C8R45DRAFT_1212942 [Mycena sanguinolenta]|nr:hypothetical protein C8R45DRAFT_1212942 [Mycena sanguinolenta]
MVSTEPSGPFASSSPAPTPDLPSPVPTPAPVASRLSRVAAIAAIAVPGTRAGTALTLASANTGFDHIFASQIALAHTAFEADNIPFHSSGSATARSSRPHSAGAKKAAAESKKGVSGCGGVVGLTHALSESYMGYFQCMYALNAAHSKFTNLYKTVFPAGLDAHFSSSSTSSSTNSASSTTSSTHSPSNSLSAKPLSRTPFIASTSGASSWNTLSLSVSTVSDEPPAAAPVPAAPTRSIFGRWASLLSTRYAASGSKVFPSFIHFPLLTHADETTLSPTPSSHSQSADPEKQEKEKAERESVGDCVWCLFNLVFSLLPKRVQSLVGLRGFEHDRVLGLRALAVSLMPLRSFIFLVRSTFC